MRVLLRKKIGGPIVRNGGAAPIVIFALRRRFETAAHVKAYHTNAENRGLRIPSHGPAIEVATLQLRSEFERKWIGIAANS